VPPGLNPPALLKAALDQIDYGIVLVDKALQVLLINRAFYRMWSLSPPLGAISRPDGHAAGVAANGLHETALRGIDAFVSRRVADVREGRQAALEIWLAGGRILKLECIDLPDGDSMVTYSNVSDLVHTGEKLRELASIDDLTKLLNRRQFLASLDDEFTRALRYGLPLSVAIIDVDHFKQVNDRHGHPVGDFVLRAIAQRCRSVIRRDDILGRLGGEEFAAAFIETDVAEALSTAERLCQEVAAEPFDVGHAKLSVTISIGLATRQAHETDTNELLWFADRAMYAAKAAGRNRVVVDIASS
jgi:diguanylate cyclase (GGDEF)-like protein